MDAPWPVKWDALERDLAARSAQLERIAVGKSPALVRQLRFRELQVSMLQREALLREQITEMDGTATVSTRSSKEREAVNVCGNVENGPTFHTTTTKSSWFRCLYEAIIFELNVTLPAVISLILHCIATGGIYEGLCAIVHSLYYYYWTAWTEGSCYSEAAVTYLDVAFYGAVFLVGVTGMRCTGDLYWWLSDRDHDCWIFDYRNRIRLGCYFRKAQMIRTVRKHAIAKVILYTVGYSLCYLTSHVLLSYVSTWGSQPTRLLKHLPSRTFRIDSYPTLLDAARHLDELDGNTARASSTFPCERTCQEEIDRVEAAYTEIQRADREYTLRALSINSHKLYWSNWIHSSDGEISGVDHQSVALFDYTSEIIFGLVVFVVGVGLLRAYGFVFWERY